MNFWKRQKIKRKTPDQEFQGTKEEDPLAQWLEIFKGGANILFGAVEVDMWQMYLSKLLEIFRIKSAS